MGWDCWLRSAAYPARFMAADSHHSIVHARRISMTSMILCLAGAGGGGLLRTLNNNPALPGGEPKTQNAYLLNWRRSLL